MQRLFPRIASIKGITGAILLSARQLIKPSASPVFPDFFVLTFVITSSAERRWLGQKRCRYGLHRGLSVCAHPATPTPYHRATVPPHNPASRSYPRTRAPPPPPHPLPSA